MLLLGEYFIGRHHRYPIEQIYFFFYGAYFLITIVLFSIFLLLFKNKILLVKIFFVINIVPLTLISILSVVLFLNLM